MSKKLSDGAKRRVEIVRASSLCNTLSKQHPSVEVWADAEFSEGGWEYFWIVSRFEKDSYRNLAYVRVKPGQMECRTYDAAGDDQWVACA